MATGKLNMEVPSASALLAVTTAVAAGTLRAVAPADAPPLVMTASLESSLVLAASVMMGSKGVTVRMLLAVMFGALSFLDDVNDLGG